MKKINNILWGILLIAIGVIISLRILGFIDVNLFFDGWWTLFIILPCGVGLVTEREKTGNLIGLCVGIFLLLCCQDVLDFSLTWKLLVPVIIILIGAKLVLKGIFGNKSAQAMQQIQANGGQMKYGNATFSGADMNFAGEEFSGAELNAIFGGVKCDLRDAIIQTDCVINATAVFGGIDIFVPDGVNVKVSSTSIFGGVGDKKKANSKDNPHTLYINATCLFGGLELK